MTDGEDNRGLLLLLPDYFVLTRQVLVHKSLSENTEEGDERPAASLPVNGIGRGEFGVFAI
jgi:hypothetical protein